MRKHKTNKGTVSVTEINKTTTTVAQFETTPKVVQSRALLIGINYTGTSSQLNGCINDTKNVYMWLTKECGYNPSSIRVLTDEAHVSNDSKPTRANIEKGIQWLYNGLSNGSPTRLFLHYSGHGSWTYDRNGDEADRRDESICPLDYATAGCIVDDDLRKLIVDPIADKDNIKLTCLFDCCHSGTAIDLRYDFEVNVASAKPDLRAFKMLQNKAYTSSKSNITLWSGCSDNQTSADAYIARQAQGAMTWGFLTTVRKIKAQNKPLTYKRVLAELQILLQTNKYEQIPHLSSSKLVLLSDTLDF
jgi:hypothetical protein